MKTVDYIERYKPCRESVKYLSQFETMQEAWNSCERGDWMLSMAHFLKIDIRLIVGAAGRCAATVKHLMKDSRSLDTLQACEKFMLNQLGAGQLRAAAYATASHAAYAADAAAYAADAAYAAADDADAARKEMKERILRYGISLL